MEKILSVIFFFFLSGRLSIFIEPFFSNISNFPTRLLTKVIWIVIYTVFVGIVLSAKKNRTKLRNFIKKEKLVILAIGAMVVSGLLSAVFGYSLVESMIGTAYYFVLFSIALLIPVVTDKNSGKKLRKGIIVSAIILSIVALVQYFDYSRNQNHGVIIQFFSNGGFVPIQAFNIRTENIGVLLRPSSLMVDPNFFAAFLAVAILFSIDILNKEKKKIFTLLSLFLFVFILLLTFSRTGIISLIVGVVVYFLIKKSGQSKMLSFAPFVFFDKLIGRFFDLGETSFNEHLDYLKASINIFMRNMLVGIGIGNYPQYYSDNINPLVSYATPHSAYMRILAELGIVGVISNVFFIVVLLLRLLRKNSALLLSVFAVILVGNITYDFFMTPWVWFLIGLMLSDTDI